MNPEDNSLESGYQTSESGFQASNNSFEPNKGQGFNFLTFKLSHLAAIVTISTVILVLLIGGSTLLYSHLHSAKNSTENSEASKGTFKVGSTIAVGQSTPSQLLQLGQVNELAVNGQLTVSKSVVLSPSSTPTTPVTGEIYYNQTSNAPYYYNGSAFVSLLPASSSPQHVTTLGGTAGIISLGSGLSINGNTLSVASSVLQQVSSTTNTPVVNSLQGLSGNVSFAGGAGIAISGTSITNTGVVGLSSSNNSINITNTGNGNYDLSLSAGAGSVTLAPSLAQADNSSNSSIFINKTGSGNSLELQDSGVDAFVVSQSGQITTGTIDYSQVQGRPTTVVNSLGGESGDITTGSGLSIAGNVLSNSGVVTIGSVSGAITLGSGLGITGNTLSNSGVTSLTGTANQVIASASTGGITLSLPQSIASSSSPTFNSQTLNGTLGVTGLSTLTGGISTTTLNTSSAATIQGALTADSTLNVQGAITAGVPGSTAGNIYLANTSSTNTVDLVGENPSGTGTATIQIPTIAGGSTDTVCLEALANCGTSSNTVTTSSAGNNGDIAEFTGAETIADSSISDNGSSVTISELLNASTINATTIESSGALSINPGGNLSVGAYNHSLSLIGNSASTLAEAANGYTDTLAFTAPTTTSHTITVPDATGTVCLDNSVSCGFATSGAGVTSLDLLAGALTINDSTGTGSTITIQNASTTQAGIAEFNSSDFQASGGVVDTIQGITTTSDVEFDSLALDNGATCAAGGNLCIGNSGTVYASNYSNPSSSNNLVINSGSTNVEFENQSGANSFLFPTYGGTGQTICTSGITCASGGGQAVILGPSGVQDTATNTTGIYVDKTGGTGNLLTLQTGSSQNALVIDASGNATFSNTTTAATLDVSGTLQAETITPNAALSVGSTSQSFTLQGNESSEILGQASGNSTYLGFNTPTSNTATTGSIYYALDNSAATNTQGTPYFVCTTAGNCSGSNGTVTALAGSSADYLSLFSATQGSGGNIENSIATETGSNTINILGNLNVGASGNGQLSVGVASSVNGTIVVNNATNNKTVTISQLSAPSSNVTLDLPTTSGTFAVSASGPLSLNSTTGVLSCPTCDSSGGGGSSAVQSLNTLVGAIVLNNASVAGQNIQINNAKADGSTLGIATFNSTNFTDNNAGLINTIQSIATTSSPTFSNLTLQGTTGLTIGSTANDGAETFLDGTADGFTQKISQTTLTGNQTISIPNASGTFAVSASGNLSLSALGNLTITSSPTFTTSVTTPLLASSAGLNITPGGTLTAGSTSQSFTLQGTASSTITATSGSFTSTLAFDSPTTANTIYLPNQGGTICLSSNNCSYEASGSYVLNQTTQQTSANIDIQSVSSAVAAKIQGASGQNILNLYSSSSSTTPVAYFDSSGDLSVTNNGTLGGTLSIGTIGTTEGSLTLNSSHSSGVFILQPSTSQATTTTLTIPTDTNSTDSLCLVTLSNCTGVNAGSGDTSYIFNQTTQQASSNIDIQSVASSVAAKIQGASGQNILNLYGSGSSTTPVDTFDSSGDLTVTGTGTFEDSSNSTTAFQVQNSADLNLLDTDTTDGLTNLYGVGNALFSYKGSTQTYTVPAGISSITVDMAAGGGGSGDGVAGASGGRLQATIPVTPGHVLTIYVASQGGNGGPNNGQSYPASPGGYGYGTGGTGGSGATGSGGGGGGATAIYDSTSSTLLAVVGGGGGGALVGLGGAGSGDGNGANGAGGAAAGGGATTSSVGAGGSGCSGNFGSSGSGNNGGAGEGGSYPGGGGGAGYYGGGGGAQFGGTGCEGAGGGGSGFIIGSATNVTNTNGYEAGNGYLEIFNTQSEEQTVSGTGVTDQSLYDNSTTAFQIQNASGTSIFTADTTDDIIDIGTNGTPSGQLYVSGSVPTSAIGSVGTGSDSNPDDVVVSGDYAYVAEGGGEFAVYNIATPNNPILVSTLNTSNSSNDYGSIPFSLSISGHYAYIADSPGAGDRLDVIDISNPDDPVFVTSIATNGGIGSVPAYVYASGNYVYEAYGGGLSTLYVINVSNPADPVIQGSLSTPGGASSVYAQGRYVYVGEYSDILQIIDVSNPTSPTNAGSVSLAGEPGSIFVQSGYAYVATGSSSSGLQIVNVSNPASPVVTGSTNTGVSERAVYVQGRYAYVLSSSSLETINISNLSSPSLVGSVATVSGSYNLFVQGMYGYVVSQNPGTFQVFDLGGEYAQQLQAGGIETGTLQVDNNAEISGDESVQGGLSVGTNAQIDGNLGLAGSALFANTTNSTTAFQVQNANAVSLLTVDTVDGNVTLDNTGSTGTVQIGNTTGAVAQTINIGNNATAGSSSNVNIGSSAGGSIKLQAYKVTQSINSSTAAGPSMKSSEEVEAGNSPQTIALPATTKANDAIIVTSSIAGNPALTVSGAGATWVQYNYDALNPALNVWVGYGATAGSTSITLTGGGLNAGGVVIGIFSGVAYNSNPVLAESTGSGGPATTGSVSYNPGDLVIGAASFYFSSGSWNTPTWSNGNSNNNIQVDSDAREARADYQVATTSGSTTYSASNTGGVSGDVISLVLAPSSGGGNDTVQSASSSALQVQDVLGNGIFNVDTTNSRVGVGTLATPTNVSVGTATSGGSLAASTTYYVKVTAIDGSGGETAASTEASGTTTSSNLTLPITWSAVTGAVSYRVYYEQGGSGGAEASYFTTSTNSYSLTTTSAGTMATPPNSSSAYADRLSSSGNTLQSLTNSTTAFQIQNSSGTNLFQVDTSGNNIYLGGNTNSTEDIGAIGTAAYTSNINIGTSTGAAQAIAIGSTNASSSLTLQAGEGITVGSILSQSLSSGTSTGTVSLLGQTATNANTGAVSTTVNADSITLIGTNNSNVGENILNGLSFNNVTAATNNTFNGLYFGTGYTNGIDFSSTSGFTNLITAPGFNINTSGGLSLGTIGTTSGSLTLNSSHSGGSFTFSSSSSQANTTTITIPTDTSSTDYICLVNVGNCSGVNGGSGDSAYIFNQTTQQASSNIDIQSISSAVAAKIQGASGQNILNLYGSGSSTTAVADFDSAGDLNINTNTTDALLIQDTSGSLLTADTTDQRVDIGTNGTESGQLYVSGTAPTYVGENSDSNLSYPESVFVSGNYAYMASNGNNKLVVYNISSGTPVYVGENSDSNLNSPSSVYVSGNYAYVASYGNNKLVVYNISSGTPVYVGENSDSNLNSPSSVYVSGNYAYVASYGNNKLVAYNISSGTPVYVGENSDSNLNSPHSVYVSGNYAYVVDEISGGKLLVYNISSGTPVYVGENSDSNLSYPYAVYVSGSYAYVVNNTAGGKLLVYNISSGTPVYVGENSDSNLNQPYDVYVSGNYAYVSNESQSNSKLLVYNISSGTPVYVGENSDSNLVRATSVYVQGNYAYVASAYNNELVSYNIGGTVTQSLQSGSTTVSTLQVSANAIISGDESVQGGLTVGTNAQIDGNLGVGGSALFENSINSTTAFQIQNSSGSSIFTADTSNNRIDIGTQGTPSGQLYVSGTVPTYVGQNSDSNLDNPFSVFVSGSYAYVANFSNNELISYNISSGTPVYVGENSTNLSDPEFVYVSGDYAYVASEGNSKLVVYNISSGTPVYVSENSDSNLSGPYSVYVSGNYAYVASGGNNKLVVYNISSGTPVYVGENSDSSLNGDRSVYVSGNYAYVASLGTNKLVVYNISSGTPVYVSENSDSNLSQPYSVYIQGSYAYVASYYNNKLVVYNISSGTPVYVGENSDSNLSNPQSVYVSGNYAYVASEGNNKLVVYNISSGTPVYVGENSDSNLSNPQSVYVSGNYAYVASWNSNKLVVYNIGGTVSQSLQAGSTDVTTLQVASDAIISGDESVQGGLTVGTNAQIGGNLGVGGKLTATTINATSDYQANGAAGSNISCSAGQPLIGTSVSEGIVTGGSCGLAYGEAQGTQLSGGGNVGNYELPLVGSGDFVGNGMTYNGTYFYVPKAGTYMVTGFLTLNLDVGNGTGAYWQLLVTHNGSNVDNGPVGSFNTGSPYSSVSVSELVTCSAGDYIGLDVSGAGMSNATPVNNFALTVSLVSQ